MLDNVVTSNSTTISTSAGTTNREVYTAGNLNRLRAESKILIELELKELNSRVEAIVKANLPLNKFTE
jgi:hypothetical protein